MLPTPRSFLLFFFNDTATTEIYTLSLHDALPISGRLALQRAGARRVSEAVPSRLEISGNSAGDQAGHRVDRKSTRLNSSHQIISYAVFCLTKKNTYQHRVSRRPDAPPVRRHNDVR